MPSCLSTPDREAYFDFLSSLIMLERYEARDLAAFEQAIAWEPGLPISDRVAHLRALLMHETTHFLDATTTAWGGQYMLRKLLMLRKLPLGEEVSRQAQEVFALETSELSVHEKLVQAGSIAPASCETIKHSLEYDADFGVYALVHYFKGDQCIHMVPVSMLSLLEANATASEYLSLLFCAESYEDHVERTLALSEVERRFDALRNDPERLEYSVLLHVTRVHFPALTLKEFFCLVAALARFALDATSIELTILANDIQWSFDSRMLADCLAMELRRDHSRQVIFFKSVLLLYGLLQHSKPKRRGELEKLIRKEPREAIRRLWTGAPFHRRGIGDEERRDATAILQRHAIENLGLLDGGRFFFCSSECNRPLLAEKSAGLLSFKELKLVNPLTGDDTEVVFPNGFDQTSRDYVDEHLGALIALDQTYLRMRQQRFHLVPGSPEILRLEDLGGRA